MLAAQKTHSLVIRLTLLHNMGTKSSIFRSSDRKSVKNEINKEMSNIGNEAKSFLDRILGDVSKKSATKQIVIGAGSGL